MENLIMISISKHELKGIIECSIQQALKNHNFEQKTKKHSFEKEIFGINEACQLLGIAKPTIYTKTSKGEIPHFKRGKKLYFRRSELLEWIEAGRKKTVHEEQEEINDYLAQKERR